MPDALETSAAPEGTVTEPVATDTTPAATTTEDEWGDPEPLAEGVQQFDRSYVEKLRDREAKYRIRARELHEQYGTLGQPDEVKQAVDLMRELGTDEGVIKFFIEAGQSLGLGFEQLEALFKASDEAAATAAAAEGPKDDDVLTWKEARELLKREVLEPQQRQQEQAMISTAQRTIQATFEELKVTDETDRQAVLALGQKYIADGDFDPEHIVNAVRKGHADYENRKAADREAYVAEKLKAAQNTPSSTGASGAAGGEAAAPPKDMEEAKKRARERLRAS